MRRRPQVEADFADLFEVKEARIPAALGRNPRSADGESLTIGAAWQGVRKGIVVRAPEPTSQPEA